MLRALQAWRSPPARPSSPCFAALASLVLLGGCTGNFSMGDLLPGSSPSAPSQSATNIGEGQVKVGHGNADMRDAGAIRHAIPPTDWVVQVSTTWRITSWPRRMLRVST